MLEQTTIRESIHLADRWGWQGSSIVLMLGVILFLLFIYTRENKK